MAKEIKRRGTKNFKEKKSFGARKESDEKSFFFKDKDSSSEEGFKKEKSNNFKEEKKHFSKKSSTDRKNKKPAFERYQDESRPSDFGSPKKRSSSGYDEFKKKSSSNESSFKRKFDDGDKKRTFNDREKDKPKTFGKKPFSTTPTAFNKPKREINPYDLDEKDLEYGKEKPAFNKDSSKGYTKKPYTKKPYPTKKATTSKPQREEEDGMIRLNKYISNAGICSRREADTLIESGVVQVNGKTITEMGFRVKPTDIIKYGGQTLKKERLVYLILNKPKDYITTVDDPQKRRTVLELVQGACKERIYPVGRLDRATTGLLMFTNDGDLTKKLTHPKYGVKKIYHVELDKPLKQQDLNAIMEGIELEDGPIKVDEVAYAAGGADKTQVGVEIHSGKNRIVRRIFEHFGYNVRKLDRVVFGSLTKKDLPRGRWRLLSDAEVGMLKMIKSE